VIYVELLNHYQKLGISSGIRNPESGIMLYFCADENDELFWAIEVGGVIDPIALVVIFPDLSRHYGTL
jgi:hypothetical protein